MCDFSGDSVDSTPSAARGTPAEPRSPQQVKALSMDLANESHHQKPFIPYDVANNNFASPDTRLSELNLPKPDPTKPDPANFIENFSQTTFSEVWRNLKDADPNDVAPGIADGWEQVRQGIVLATAEFQMQLEKLKVADHIWKGYAHDTAVDKMVTSLQTPRNISDGAHVLSIITDAFSKTMKRTRDLICGNYDNYTTSRASRANSKDADFVDQVYDSFARAVMHHVYSPNIQAIHTAIEQNHSAFNTAAPGPTPGLGQGGPTGPGPSNAGVGGTGPHASPSMPAIPATPFHLNDPSAKPSPDPTPQNTAELAEMAQSLQQGISEAAQSAGQAASQAGQAASQAAQRSNTGALTASQHPLPPGVLSLGPKSPTGALGGARPTGAPARGAVTAKPAGVPAAATANTVAAKAAATNSGARIAGAAGTTGAGMPGAGAPAAAHRPGGANEGAQHQPSKVLRSKKNGEQIMGDTEAVVAVLGEPAQPEPAKPNPT